LFIPRNVGAAPYFYNHSIKSAGTPIARHFGSQYPFGHGLSYTTFEFSGLALESDTVDIETGDIRLSFLIRNTGSRLGVAVPQLYIRDELASFVRPVKELKAFGKVELTPGDEARITFVVPVDMLNFTGQEGKRMVEPGFFTLMVGESSANIKLKTRVEVTGERRLLSGKWRMESSFLV
jgi:hypothetical protein